jgi:homoserine kinase type II
VGERFDDADALTGPSRFDLAALRARLAGVDASNAEVATAVARIGAVLDDVETRPAPARELPLVHGDLFRDNVLFTERGAILLDFESASRGRAAFDVAVTMLAWCFGDTLDSGLCRAFASGYSAGRNLAVAEASELFDAARLACARFTTTRLTDYEQRPRGLGVYKDFRRWIRRLDAVEAIGRDAFPRAFGFG